DTINAVNEKIGMTENFWEHRSFKEQGLDIIPQIHLGEKASAMERAGIRTIRGDINRDIIAKNAVITIESAVYRTVRTVL
ncbi:MAG: MobA/MobL family protein, partial [Lachnospiraceae bacterium]|nr:MobA/MobL family protein [Lachnospiraceae bacterium]